MQLVPLNLLTPYNTKELVLDLQKNTDINDPQNKKPRGKLEVELMYTPLREESMRFLENSNSDVQSESRSNVDIQSESRSNVEPENQTLDRAGVLSVKVQGARNVEGEKHNNPYAVIHLRGEKRKTKVKFRFRYIFQIMSFSSFVGLLIFVRNHEPPQWYDIVHFEHKALLLVSRQYLIPIKMYSLLIDPWSTP